MKSIPLLLLTVALFTCSFTSFSQADTDEDKLSLNSGTIDNQFDFVIQKSNGWRDERGQTYKVIRSNWLTDLKAHTLDSLKAVKKDLVDTQIVVKSQDKEISDLKTNLSNTKNELENTHEEKNNMALFGLQMSKTNYNVLMWSIILALLVLLLFFIYKFKNSNAITRLAQDNLAEVEEEFDEHRKTALEREQKVRRQLQDEINKQKLKK
ncbi:tRNA (guanine-N1)-methyltransferase [Mariniflexile ostreae]|uniref:tRNA (Guanine-N1)-methyltransferase n=1 Tax=Mariniflexile ostreae TaxID=1520892 RepID=A0ABV5FEM9_9FLAO